MRWLNRPSMIWRLFGHVRLAGRLLRDPAVPMRLKLAPIAAGLYLIAPIDLVPDFIAILGQLDDLTVLTLATESFLRWCPPGIVHFHRTAIAERRPYSPMPVPVPEGGKVFDAQFRRD